MGQLMVEGDKWEMYIPSELGYGDGAKKRAAHCNLKTKEDCDADELKILETWAKKPIEEINAEMAAIKKKLDGVLKSGEREKVKPTFDMLKKITKARAKGEEL